MDLQTLIALGIVAACLALVIRRTWRTFGKKSGSGCTACHGGSAADAPPTREPEA